MLGRPDPLRVLPRGCGYARLGFRLVVPYLDACRVRVKAAWVGRKIEQVRSSPRVALTVIATLVHV